MSVGLQTSKPDVTRDE